MEYRRFSLVNSLTFLKKIPNIKIILGLSLFWSQCKNYGMGLSDVVRLMCAAPAELCGINDRKGKIAEGYDAGMCIIESASKCSSSSTSLQIFVFGIRTLNSQLPKTLYSFRTKPIHTWGEG